MQTARLLTIDPQNDFMDISGAALPVAGATADMERVAALVDRLGPRLTDLMLTLDSHASYGIERDTFWLDDDGVGVEPFTQIHSADILSGRYRPADSSLNAEVLRYLRALEAGGQYTLMVWPVHCVLGTWGHNIHTPLAEAVSRWEAARGQVAERVLKGRNPMTEQYSALRAEVPRPDDPLTQMNEALLARMLRGDGPLLVAGEALSHCVTATMDDAFERMKPQQRANVILLSDCMSPVEGFEEAGLDFLRRAQAQQAQVLTAWQVLELFDATGAGPL